MHDLEIISTDDDGSISNQKISFCKDYVLNKADYV